MPNAIIENISQSTGMKPAELDAIWNKAVKEAESKKISNKYGYANAVLQHIKKSKTTNDAETQRYIDDNGFLICPNSVITGEDVAMYYGHEIPNSKKLGLETNKIYNVYRPINEIKDNDFNGKYLLESHLGDFGVTTTDKYQKYIIGTVYDCKQTEDEIKGTVSFTNPNAIDKLSDGKKYLSAGYFYDPVLEKGLYNGKHYDIKMTNIRANHVAHVDNPRYKNAIVGDSNIITNVRVAKAKALADYILINAIRSNYELRSKKHFI